MDDTWRERGEWGRREPDVVVGGGPAGCSAGVFTARYGLDTGVVFDRGNSSLRRCAHLENHSSVRKSSLTDGGTSPSGVCSRVRTLLHPGFPGGIDVGTYGLMHDHAGEAASGDEGDRA